MTTKYLDSNGLSYFWGKIKALIPTKTSDITNDSGFITNPNIPYCTCATAAGTKAKTTTIVSGTFTDDDLVTGAQVLVKFTNANSVADPTLKIGSTTAKTIKRYGTTAPSTSAASSWNAGAVMMFTYDGTYWLMVDWVNTTYTSMTVAEIEAGTGTTARSITPARLKTAVQTWDAVTSVNSQTGAVTLTASDVGALPSNTTYVSSFNGNTGAVTYTAPVTSVNSKTGAVTLTASDVGALPDSTTIPSKLSDLTNDLIYDLGTVTVNAGVFSVSADDVTAITALWNDGFCGLKLTVNSKDYYAYKERTVTYGGMSFMGFVAVEADLVSNAPITGKTIVGINSSGVGMFYIVNDFTGDDVPLYEQDPVFRASAASGIQASDITDWNGKQDALVSGTNIKTINNYSILGSGNLDIGGSQPIQEIYIAEYGTTTYADVLSAYNDNKAIFVKRVEVGTGATIIPLGTYYSSTNVFDFCFAEGNTVTKYSLTNSDTWSSNTTNSVPTTRKVNNKALSADITLSASDVGALSTSTTYVSSFNGNTGAVTYTAPVTSVNSKTGAVTLTATDVGALADTTPIPANTSDLNNDSGFISDTTSIGKTPFTPTSGSSYTYYGGCYYEKYGRVVHVHIGVSGLSANAQTQIYTLPNGYIPSSLIVAHGTSGTWDGLAYAEITTTGAVNVRSKGTYCCADLTFLV